MRDVDKHTHKNTLSHTVSCQSQDADESNTDCTPYLLNLGLTKSSTSAVWIAGPLSGLIVQPIVGVIADESTSRWGRRRPFILAGTIIVAMSLLVLGFTREIVGVVLGQGADADERAKVPTIVLAVLAIYVTDFAINAGWFGLSLDCVLNAC